MKKFVNNIEKLFGLKVNDFEINDDGQNNTIIIVNKVYVFRIPKFDGGIGKLKESVEQMESLKADYKLMIPQYKFINLDNRLGEIMVGYDFIPGKALLREKFDLLNNREYFAEQLGIFLRKLHSEQVSNDLFKVSDPYDYYQRMYEDIKELLFEYMSDESKIEVSKLYEDFLETKGSVNLTLVHGDFGPTNILTDGNEITGIIDFDSLHIGDSAVDIASLMGPFGYGEAFVRMMEKHYGDLTDLIDRARFYRQTFALEDALFGIKYNDLETFEFGIRTYR